MQAKNKKVKDDQENKKGRKLVENLKIIEERAEMGRESTT